MYCLLHSSKSSSFSYLWTQKAGDILEVFCFWPPFVFKAWICVLPRLCTEFKQVKDVRFCPKDGSDFF